jgi:hypothetical protein
MAVAHTHNHTCAGSDTLTTVLKQNKRMANAHTSKGSANAHAHTNAWQTHTHFTPTHYYQKENQLLKPLPVFAPGWPVIEW